MCPIKPGLTAKDIMSTDPVCVTASTRMRELARILTEHDIAGVPVVDQQGRVIGVVSKSDLVRLCIEGMQDVPPASLLAVFARRASDDLDGDANVEPLVCVEEFMTSPAVTVRPEVPVETVAHVMFDHHVHRVVVVDADMFPLGIITSMDMLGVLTK